MNVVRSESCQGRKIIVYRRETSIPIGKSSIGDVEYFVFINEVDISRRVMYLNTGIDDWIASAKRLIDQDIRNASKGE